MLFAVGLGICVSRRVGEAVAGNLWAHWERRGSVSPRRLNVTVNVIYFAV